jgi:hypothetical protein
VPEQASKPRIDSNVRSGNASFVTRTTTSPALVNFTALPIRLVKTWRKHRTLCRCNMHHFSVRRLYALHLSRGVHLSYHVGLNFESHAIKCCLAGYFIGNRTGEVVIDAGFSSGGMLWRVRWEPFTPRAKETEPGAKVGSCGA